MNKKSNDIKYIKVEKDIEDILKMPYTNETMLKEIKRALKPTLDMIKVAEKYSDSINGYAEFCSKDQNYDLEACEDCIFRKVDENSYANALKIIKNTSIMLIGKTLLMMNANIDDLEKYIIQIKDTLNYVYDISTFAQSGLYEYPYEFDTYDYVKLADKNC